MVFENNVTEFREKRGLSKQKLSQLTGISPSNIYHIETAKTFPYPGWRKRLAEALSTSEENLFPQYTRRKLK
ncbi:helix-turn-helix transcriptional regulator [Clostridium sp.]